MKLAQFAKSVVHPARSATGAVLSLLAARLVGLPEVWWAPISTLVVMQSNLGPLTIAWQRWAGTALGSASGALLATCFGSGVVAYGCGVFGVGLVCAALQLGVAASRFAAIALTIVMLVAHAGQVWATAFHRFLEVSLGIAVGLVIAVLWPEPKGTDGSK
ncbi:MAG TPA: FUSC family protein [Chthoniobacteraceae bacterium]|nr:FUSC family protein [Chthoniobacteraceae bacterium]